MYIHIASFLLLSISVSSEVIATDVMCVATVKCGDAYDATTLSLHFSMHSYVCLSYGKLYLATTYIIVSYMKATSTM